MNRSFLFAILIALGSCVTEQIEEVAPAREADFSFPKSFDFSTARTITLKVSSANENVKFNVYYFDQGVQNLVATFGSSGQEKTHSITIPKYLRELQIDEISSQGTSTRAVSIGENNVAEVTFASPAGRSSVMDCKDRLYAVASTNGGFSSIDLSSGAYEETALPNLEGGGSIACTLDQKNGLVYYNRGKVLYNYNIAKKEFNTVFNGNPFNGNYPRLAYRNGFFYMSNGTKLYKVNAINNDVVEQFDIVGIQNTASGGDLDFDTQGHLYLSCFSGLYKFTSFNGTQATVARISAENFPFQLTSMAIDRKDRIFVATNDSQSKLIEIDKADGSYRIVRTYNHKINDLAAWNCETSALAQTDTDGDGIIDVLDEYPQDASAAFDVFTPSSIGYGTLAFEDLWPQTGDYDFNDLVVNYRMQAVLNANNEAVRMKMNFKIMAAGATYKNGFGILLPVDKADIANITGFELTEGIISLDEKGLELNQSGSVVIVFDNAINQLGGGSIINTQDHNTLVPAKELEIVIRFNRLIEASALADAPFNPFIFIDGNRSREVHLKNYLPTDLADRDYFNSADDRSQLTDEITYVSESNAPWGIHIIHRFRYPKEKRRIDRAYHHFLSWGRSSGTLYEDWYKDNQGYRNMDELIFNDN